MTLGTTPSSQEQNKNGRLKGVLSGRGLYRDLLSVRLVLELVGKISEKNQKKQ